MGLRVEAHIDIPKGCDGGGACEDLNERADCGRGREDLLDALLGREDLLDDRFGALFRGCAPGVGTRGPCGILLSCDSRALLDDAGRYTCRCGNEAVEEVRWEVKSLLWPKLEVLLTYWA